MESDRQISAVLKAMKSAYGSGRLVVADLHRTSPGVWHSPHVVSANSDLTPKQAERGIFEYIILRVKEEIKAVGGEAQITSAKPAIRRIFENEARVMKTVDGHVLVVHRNHSHKIEQPALLPGAFELNRSTMGEGDITLSKALKRLPGTNISFYHTKRDAILLKLEPGIDYDHLEKPIAEGTRINKIPCLTPSGQEKLPDIVKDLLSNFRPYDGSSLHAVLKSVEGATNSFVIGRKGKILAQLTEGEDFIFIDGDSSTKYVLTPSGVLKARSTAAEMLKNYPSIGARERN